MNYGNQINPKRIANNQIVTRRTKPYLKRTPYEVVSFFVLNC